jgi:hypothetical protein
LNKSTFSLRHTLESLFHPLYLSSWVSCLYLSSFVGMRSGGLKRGAELLKENGTCARVGRHDESCPLND